MLRQILLQIRNKPGCKSRLNRSEIITIIIGYLQVSYDCFKNYYLKQIWVYHQDDFQIVSYSQFIKLIGRYLPVLVLMLNSTFDKCDGVSFVESSSIEVCKRYLSAITILIKGLKGKLFSDKGYISKEVFNGLFKKDLQLFTGIRKNMKNHLLELEDKKLSRKRVLIESVFNVLKNHMNSEYTRHSRLPINFLVHIIACVAAYTIKKSH